MAPPPQIPLRQWAWRSFVTTTLMPMLIVEAVLLTAYLGMSLYTHRRSSETLRAQSQAQLDERVRAEAATLGARLGAIERLTALLAQQSRRALAQPAPAPAHDYITRDDGSYVSAWVVPSRSSLFYSGAHPIGPLERDKAHRTERLDAGLQDIVDAEPLAVQAYLNTWDSLNRIFPPVAADQFPSRMDIPEFNFYYLADQAHNPDRGVVWTETYLDPAGAGWITSAVAPVYAGDTLEGVVGIDVTVQTMIDGVLDLELPWDGHPLLLSAEGSLLAASPAATAELGLGALPAVDGAGQVEQDTLPEAYDLSAQPESAQLAGLIGRSDAGVTAMDLRGERLVSWARIGGTEWALLFVIDEAAVYTPVDAMRADALRIGTVLVIGIVAFYIAYLLFLYRRAVRAVEQVVLPLERLRESIAAIAAGHYQQPHIRSTIAELDNIAKDVVEMGQRLRQNVDALIQKEAALQSAEARAEAERSARMAKTQFLANISHEIRTPMNGVLGLMELLEESATPAQLPTLQAARGSGQSLLRLIDDLLDAAKLEMGKMTLERRPLDLHALIDGVVRLFSAKAADKWLRLVSSVAEDVPSHIIGDELRLRQILSNLIANAIKFTATGEVRLSVSATTSGGLCFEVQDTGIGIPAERIARILEPFSQADDSTTRLFGGTGLGLTISAGLIAQMGGRFSVESSVGVGSIFRFSVPAEACEAPARANSEPATSARSLRVLVAEDHPVNQMVIRQMLTRLGHRITMASDGTEALACYAPGAFDVAIFDVHMPRMDGLTLTRSLRLREVASGAPRLPILALTASVMAEELEACHDAGMDAHLTKPVKLKTLARALNALTADPSSVLLTQAL